MAFFHQSPGCGGICLGNSRAMRKYRGLDENGQEILEAFCHPSCDLCPHCDCLETSNFLSLEFQISPTNIWSMFFLKI